MFARDVRGEAVVDPHLLVLRRQKARRLGVSGLAVAVHVRLRLRRVVSVQALSRTVRCFQASDGLFSQATCPDILPWTNER